MTALSDGILLTVLALAAAAYAVAGLVPFNFDFSRPSRVRLVYVTPVNGVLNWLCFVPIGYLLAELSFVQRPVITAAIVCGLMSLMVETLQRFVPGRFCCVSDWALNVGGGISGAWLAGVGEA